MAQDSRAVRRKRRIRRNLSQSRKTVATLQSAYLRTHSTLLMVLMAAGSITVDRATMQRVLDTLPTLSWQSQPEGDGSFTLSLVTPPNASQGDATVSVPTLSVRRLPDDEADQQTGAEVI